MKVYLIENENVAKQLGQLLRLNSECAKLHWSRMIKDIPEDVISSLETIEEFVARRVFEVCDEKNIVSSLSDEEEAEMMTLLRKKPELRSTLGMGVIMAGEEAEIVAKVLNEHNFSKVLTTAIDSGKNVILF